MKPVTVEISDEAVARWRALRGYRAAAGGRCNCGCRCAARGVAALSAGADPTTVRPTAPVSGAAPAPV